MSLVTEAYARCHSAELPAQPRHFQNPRALQSLYPGLTWRALWWVVLGTEMRRLRLLLGPR